MRRPALGLVLLAAACASSRSKEEALRPDTAALALETQVKARSAELVLSDYWREEAQLRATSLDRSDPDIDVGTGAAIFQLRGLRVEAAGTIRVKWLADHENLLLYARDVALFAQTRDQPYHSTDLSAVAMANDQVSFFQQ